MPHERTETIVNDAGIELAFRRSRGAGPAILWLCGFRGTMTGQKAGALHAQADRQGRSFLRFDYTGHGQSGGEFANSVLTTWIGDALFMIDRLTEGPVVIVGSSMGGWIAIQAALARPERVRGLLLIAPAPDFTERLLWPALDESQRLRLQTEGMIELASRYAVEPDIITQKLLEDGRAHLVLGKPIPFRGPVRIVHGMRDADVPHSLSLELIQALISDDVRATLVKAGDHRLSEPSDIALIEASLHALLEDLA